MGAVVLALFLFADDIGGSPRFCGGTHFRAMPRRHPATLFVRQHAALFALIALNFLVFLGQVIFPEHVFARFEVVPAEITATWRALLEGEASPGGIAGFAPLLTYAFLHADIQHVAFNMLYLWIFAYLVGELLGQRWTLAIYPLTAVGGALCYIVFNADSTIPMLGASGAVTGFEGAYLGLAVRYSLPDPFVWPLSRPVPPMTLCVLALVGVFLDISGAFNPAGSNTAFTAHLGGFITGLAITSFFTPFPKGASRR
ncbi:hypothetical protein BH23VER1_BH23VER1_30300 [soil metagenome]